MDGFLSVLRQQRVVVNGVKSDWASVLSGVPRALFVVLLLFCLYSNDINQIFSLK